MTVPKDELEEKFQIIEDDPKESETEEILSEEPLEEVIEELEPTQQLQQPYVPQVFEFCPACGTKNNGGKFCRNCGRNLQR